MRATGGYTPSLPVVLATKPLTQAQRAGLNLGHRIAFNDIRNLRIYAQVMPEGRIASAGAWPVPLRTRGLGVVRHHGRMHRRIHDTLLGFFPSLVGVPITDCWNGPLGVPRGWHPSVGLNRTTGHPGLAPTSVTEWPPATSPRPC